MTLKQVLNDLQKESIDLDPCFSIHAAKIRSKRFNQVTIYQIQNTSNWMGFTRLRVLFYDYLPYGYPLSELAELYQMSEDCFKPIAIKSFGKWRSIEEITNDHRKA